MGDPRDSADRADMIARSPLFRADSARAPLLIFQGANDPRVTQTQADQIAAAWKRRGIPVTYLLASNEGHGFGEAEIALAVNRRRRCFWEWPRRPSPEERDEADGVRLEGAVCGSAEVNSANGDSGRQDPTAAVTVSSMAIRRTRRTCAAVRVRLSNVNPDL
jgi:dienelactone hydrolase